MKEANFERFWESTINPATPQHVVAHWREHELTAVQRGAEIVAQLQEFTPLEGRRILDLGCGYGGVTVALALAGASVVGTDYEAQRLRGQQFERAKIIRIAECSYSRVQESTSLLSGMRSMSSSATTFLSMY